MTIFNADYFDLVGQKIVAVKGDPTEDRVIPARYILFDDQKHYVDLDGILGFQVYISSVSWEHMNLNFPDANTLHKNDR
jgi:hypothetical protein